MNATSPTLPEHLTSAAVALTRVFAPALARATSGSPLALAGDEISRATRTIATLYPDAPKTLRRRVLRRWGLLLSAATRSVDSASRRRPNLLTLVVDALAIPEHPHSRAIAASVVAAALRQAYGIRATLDDATALRQQWEEIAAAFAGQQRRRVKRAWGPHAFFLLDLAALEGTLWLAPSSASHLLYCGTFLNHPFGVENGRRDFGDGYWPEIFGRLPSLPTLFKRAFGQPLAIPGLDDVLGPLLPGFEFQSATPGLINVIAGPPGSGKTTLALTIAAAQADLGASVRFLAAEESLATLSTKVTGYVPPTPRSVWSEWNAALRAARGDLKFIEAESFRSLDELVRRVEAELGMVRSPSSSATAATFPHVLVIDSLGAVLERSRDKGGLAVHEVRRRLRGALQRLRDVGVCAYIVAGARDADDTQIDYLVDNVIRLGFETRPGARHSPRMLSLDKTRLQHSHRGRHALHIAPGDGLSVSPSLHSVVRRLKAEPVNEPVPTYVARLPYDGSLGPTESARPTLRAGAHTLIYGVGSSGKASLALACALAPRDRVPRGHGGVNIRDVNPGGPRDKTRRTLVISFLYPDQYYRTLFAGLRSQRQTGRDVAPDSMDVWALYPGFIDAETFVFRLQRFVDMAELEGRPYSSVVIDGIHNLLLEFPLLQSDELLWPCVYRLLRSRGISAVSTFTFFQVDDDADATNSRVRALAQPGTSLAEHSELFLHMLVSCCDYSFNIQRGSDGETRAKIASSLDDGLCVGQTYAWNAERFSLQPPRTSAFRPRMNTGLSG